MCGFVLTSGKNVNRDWVVNGIQLLKHRGPDYTGFHSDLNLECAHARLAIIDLDKRSNQPMISDCGIILLFNGEVFNYKYLREDLEKKGMVFNTNSLLFERSYISAYPISSVIKLNFFIV